MSTRVSVMRLAEVLGMTPRRVQQLVPEGMPKGARGEYALEACVQWLIKHLQSKIANGRPVGTTGLSPRERLDCAKAEQEEYRLAQLRKEMVTIADYEQAMSALITPARHELLALEAKLRPKIGPEAAALVGAEIRRALRDLGGDMEASA